MTIPPRAGLYIKCFFEIGVEELDWPAQSPDLNPIKLFWDESERQLRARPNRLKSVPDLINAVVAEWKHVPHSNVLTSSARPSQKT